MKSTLERKQILIELSKKVIENNQVALAKAITLIESDPELVFEIEHIYKNRKATNQPHVIGFTGSPGTGKSTLTDSFVTLLRREGKKVGIVAVDPSSPFTGGALLGDRIRMKRHFTDENVFIRSMGSRGNVGGLNDSIFGVLMLYKLFGFDYILIETVGAGQSEIDVVYVADTIVLVLSPGGGDEIQLLKAGIMEIADIFVINKSDLDGADLLKLNLETMLSFSESKKPIVMCTATSGKGVNELFTEIQKHKSSLYESGEIISRDLRRRKKHAETILHKRIQKILSDNVSYNDVHEIIDYVLEKFCKSSTASKGMQ